MVSTRKDSTSSVRSSFDFLRPVEQPQQPSGMYTPVIRHGPLFSSHAWDQFKPIDKPQRQSSIFTDLVRRPLFGRKKKVVKDTNLAKKGKPGYPPKVPDIVFAAG